VLIAAIVSKAGLPEKVTVARSLDPEMDQKAVAAVRGWKFKPGTKDGKPVRVSVHIEVQFNVI
jgi:protein TonB